MESSAYAGVSDSPLQVSRKRTTENMSIRQAKKKIEAVINKIMRPAGVENIIVAGLLMKHQFLQCRRDAKDLHYGLLLVGGIGGTGISFCP